MPDIDLLIDTSEILVHQCYPSSSLTIFSGYKEVFTSQDEFYPDFGMSSVLYGMHLVCSATSCLKQL